MNKHIQLNRRRRQGFTLVEMLVSVGVVLVMMSLFTAIFSVASSTVRTQRGIASNDERARGLVTMIRRDFAKRTQRYVLPFHPQEDPSWDTTGKGGFNKRQGYLYISTNEEDSYQDDLVQFTVDASIISEDQDTRKYAGRATAITTPLENDPNQPEADDALTTPNGIAESNKAEVMYFVRNGKLYRRVSLLREPLTFLSGPNIVQPSSGAAGLGLDLFAATAYAGEFPQEFDFSARPVAASVNLNIPNALKFIGADELDNSKTTGTPVGVPFYRYGFNPLTGLSREHDATSTLRFLGRFLQAETSDPGFNWPNESSTQGNGNPLDIVNTPLPLVPGEDVVTAFAGSTGRGGVRRMEDLLLSNVQEFRVELWDARVERFVVPSYGKFTDSAADMGDYHIARRLNPYAKPAEGGVFDTWHPNLAAFREDVNGDGILNPASAVDPGAEDTNANNSLDNGFYNLRLALSFNPTEDTNGNGDLDPGPGGEDVNKNQVLDVTEDTNGNGILDPGEDTVTVNGILDPAEDLNGGGNFDLGEDIGNGILDPDEDLNNNGTLDPGEDTNGNGILDSTEDINGNGSLDPGEDKGNGILDAGEDLNSNGFIDPAEDLNRNGIIDPVLTYEPEPPFLPYRHYPPRRSEDVNGNGSADAIEDVNKNGILDPGAAMEGPSSPYALDPSPARYWQPGTSYSLGDIVFSLKPGFPSWDLQEQDTINNDIFDPGEDLNNNGRVDVADGRFDWAIDHPAVPTGAFQVAYQCLGGGTSGGSAPSGAIGSPVSDGVLTWLVIDNRRPLQAIRLTIRYLDPPSDQIRQVQMVVPLTKQ